MYLFYLAYDYDKLVPNGNIGLMLCQHCLSAEEKLHISTYKHMKTALQQTLSFGLRRLVLALLLQEDCYSNRLGIESLTEQNIKIDRATLGLAASLSLKYARRGKPYLDPLSALPKPQASLFFSVSHCDDFICILIANDQEYLGVDAEAFKIVNYQTMLAVMHPCEQQKIQNACDFLFYWTRKEAYLKALGTGLIDELAQINTVGSQVIDERTTAKRKLDAVDKPLYCHEVDLHPKLLIHVCHNNPKQQLQLVNLHQLFA
ncbi:hypothetical protein AAEX37_01895 [Oligella sp. MSHR50489EDL]|uniref:4'-phosphopantetheinyl transferase family protein n=1 Tax=Oligella sp. MSHR50489EDL TaxID=3139409 RepID=UPI003D81712B